MKNNLKKMPQKNPESIPFLKDKIIKLQTQIETLKVKLLKFQTKNLKQEQQIIQLTAKIKLKEERPFIVINPVHTKPPNS